MDMDRGTSVDSACDGAGGEIAGDRAAGPARPAVLACAEDYERALARIDELWNFSFGTPEYAETERLCDLVHAYEEEQWASMGDGALRQAYEDAKSPSRAAGLLVEARLALEAVHRDLRQAHRDLEHHISMRQAAHDVLDLAMAWGREAVAEVGDRQDHGGSVDGRRLAMAIERAREHASQRDHATRLMMEARRERDEALREVGEVTRLLRLWHADELARRQERDEARAEAVRLREELHRNSTWTGLVCQDLQR